MTKQATVYRQGDVWIYGVSKTEYDEGRHRHGKLFAPDPVKGVILAEGEVTGHHHRIAESKRVALRPSRENGLVRFLEVGPGKPVSLVHEEHETISIPPGYYEVRIQREYAPTERFKQSYVRD